MHMYLILFANSPTKQTTLTCTGIFFSNKLFDISITGLSALGCTIFDAYSTTSRVA